MTHEVILEKATANQNILGAIAGDVIGSVYEWNRIKTKDFPLFSDRSDYTDDSVLTLAVADSLANGKDYSQTIWEYSRNDPSRGYGGMFRHWMTDVERKPYKSYGNGSAMRVSAVIFLCDTEEEVLEQAKKSAEPTHNHEEGIKGAQAIALAGFMARKGNTKQEIKTRIQTDFGYDLDRTLEEVRPMYYFNETCQGTVPEALLSFLESTSYEDAIRNAISLGGDSDTLACIAGGMAAAFYGEVPLEIRNKVCRILPDNYLKLIAQLTQ